MHNFSTREIPDKKTAIAVHARLRASSAAPVQLGRFYVAILERRLWPTQQELAQACGVSSATVSRSIAIAAFPAEVLGAFDNGERLTYRTANTVQALIAALGNEVVRANARRVRRGDSQSIDDIITTIAAGKTPPSANSRLKLTVARDRRYIRIDSSQIDRLIPRLKQIEDLLMVFVLAD